MNFTNENDKRLSYCAEVHNGRVLGNVAKLTPVKPVLMIPKVEENKYSYAAYNDPTIRALSNFRIRTAGRSLTVTVEPAIVYQVICFL